MLKQLVANFIDVIYPPKCITCNAHITKEHCFCHDCWGRFEFISEPLCVQCGVPIATHYLGNKCEWCVDARYYFRKNQSVVRYKDEIKNLIHDLKFNDKTQLAKPIAVCMVNKFTSVIESGNFLVPVPMHPVKLAKRRYNQAVLIAKHIERITGKPLLLDTLVKIRDTSMQSDLNKKERYNNLKDAFQVKDPALIKDSELLLIDDVMTTGATADACSRALLKAGAKKVSVLTFARTY